MSDWWVLVADTRTGQILEELPHSDRRWERSLDLDHTDTVTVTTSLLSPTARGERSVRDRARAVASGPWQLSLVIVRDGTAIAAGPLVSHQADTDKVTFTCTAIQKILEARLAVAAGYELDPTAGKAALNLRTSPAGAIVTLLTLATTGLGRELPLLLPADPGIGSVYYSWPGADLASSWERIKSVYEEQHGPDVRITPTLNGSQTQLTWRVELGAPQLGAAAAPWAWDYGSGCTDLSEDSDSSGLAHRWWLPGDAVGVAGQDYDLVKALGSSQNLAAVTVGAPLLERVSRQSASARDKLLLDRQAAGLTDSASTPAVTWKVTVDPERDPVIGTWELGDHAQLSVRSPDLGSPAHGWIDDGDYIRRIIGASGGVGGGVDLELSPDLLAGAQ